MRAYIEIWNPTINVHFNTIEEDTESEADARAQFSALAQIISKMEQPNSTLCLDTSTGLMMFTQKFLTDSILRLKVIED